ncbi:hypothetical protein ACEPAG_3964 [Sanghuangporus baumii]
MIREIQRILGGDSYLCSHAGSSQYSADGSSSACGLAAMNCIRHVLSYERQGTAGPELIEKLLSNETMEDIVSICTRWTSNAHLEVDEIHKTPLFQASLKLIRTSYDRAGRAQFKSMLSRLCQDSKARDGDVSCAVVITRPPEIVSCLKIARVPKDLFVIFDSHPRPAHPDGAAFFFSSSLEDSVDHLTELFPVNENLLGPRSGLQWQAELLAHVSGHFFVCSNNDMRMSRVAEQAFLEASCAILSARVQEKESSSKCMMLSSENERLKKDLDLAEDRVRELKRERAASFLDQAEPYWLKHALEPDSSVRQLHSSAMRNETGFASRHHNPIRVTKSGSVPYQEDSHSHQWREPSLHNSAKGKEKASYSEDEDDFDAAVRTHLEFQAEEAELAAQLQYLQASLVQETFDCSICMDELPIDDVARLDGCEHSFCRTCIRQYISTKLDERKFPIPCPCCTTAKDGRRVGAVSVTLIHQIGISEQAYAIFNELQISKFSVPIHCRSCNQSAFVDKCEFERTKILFCPFRDCTYSWCKDCQQEVPTSTDGPIHSCDGSEELNHLMSRQGWKHCPGCQTPTEKTEGCNHMTCGTPGCNTHFCYTCGGLIVRSSQRAEINAEVKRHYNANCALFHVPRED